MEEKKSTGISIDGLIKAYSFLNSFSLNNPSEQEKAGIIKSFEFCYELSWKLLKKALFVKGLNITTPKDVFREAADANLINDPRVWFKFLEERNKTVHTYNLETVEGIILKIIPQFKQEVEKIIETLKDVF